MTYQNEKWREFNGSNKSKTTVVVETQLLFTYKSFRHRNNYKNPKLVQRVNLLINYRGVGYDIIQHLFLY